MGVVVHCFGDFDVTVDGRPVTSLGASERRLMARLCLQPGLAMTRRALAEELWPDVGWEVSGNRLRTALVGLRKALTVDAAIESDRWEIKVVPSVVAVDVSVARSAEQSTRRAVSDTELERSLCHLVETAKRELLSGWTETWADEARVHWHTVRTLGLERLSQLCDSRGDVDGAVKWSSCLVEHAPFRSASWELYFRATGIAGKGAEASRAFLRAVKAHGLEGPEWDDLRLTARMARGKPHVSRYRLSPPESQLIERAFVRLLADAPSEVVRFVCTPAFKYEADLEPAQAANLVNRLIELYPDHIGLREVALRVSGMLNDRDGVRRSATWLLDHDQDPSRRCGYLHMLTFNSSLNGEWDCALAQIEEAIGLADGIGSTSQYWRARVQRATVLTDLGRFDEAFREYQESFAWLSGAGATTSHTLASTAFNAGNALAMRGREEESDAWLARARDLTATHQLDDLSSLVFSASGYVWTILGRREEGAQAAVEGVALSVRRSNWPHFCQALTFVAGVLASVGKGSASTGVLDCVERFRTKVGLALSPGRAQFAERIRVVADSRPDPEWRRLTKPNDLAKAVIIAVEM